MHSVRPFITSSRTCLAFITIALATASTGCGWLLSGGDRAAQRAAAANTVPLEITNTSSQRFCSIKIWNDKLTAELPDHNWLENTVETPMGLEVKVLPLEPGDSRYIRVSRMETYHSKLTTCGGTEQVADDVVVDRRAVRWTIQ